MRILILGFSFSCIFAASVQTMQDSSSNFPHELKKISLTFEGSTDFAGSELYEFAQKINCKDVRLIGVASLSNSCLLAISLATLKQKDDVCIFSRKISWRVQEVDGIKCSVFSHSKMSSADKITKVEISQGQACLGVTLETQSQSEYSKDLLIFEEYLGIDPMRLTGCKNLEKKELGK